jgi:hypothetical protein
MDQVWFCGNCRSLNEIRNKSCYRCLAKRDVSEVVPEGASLVGLGSGTLPKDPSIRGALFLGLLVTIAAIWAWYTVEPGIERFQGRLAWLIGVVIGFAVLIGGRGRSSLMSVIISAALAVFAIAAGEYLIASRTLADQTGEVFDGLAVAPPSAVVAEIARVLGDDPLRPILWAFGIVAAVAIPWRGLIGSRDAGDDD